MPTARYWRVKNIDLASDYLEISEWRLYNGSIPVDSEATITSQAAPLSAAPLSRLIDGAQNVGIAWPTAVAEDPAFWIKWDLGSSIDVTGTRVSAYDNGSRFPSSFRMEYSTNDTDWTTFVEPSVVPFRGAYMFSDFYPALPPTQRFYTLPYSMPAPYAPAPMGTVYRDPAIRNHRRDFEGHGRIVGTTKEKALPSNTPLRRHVYCMDMLTSTIVGDLWSDAATGAYVFNDLDLTRRYTVYSYDHSNAYRAVIADNLQPELMP